MFLSGVEVRKRKRMQTRYENLVGRTIAGYRLLEMLGRGGMSMVFLAQRLDNPQARVAIKILVPFDALTAEELLSFQARFLREAQAAYQMHQKHILPVLGYGAEDDMFYMVMPVIAGGTLAERVASEQGQMPLEEIAGYLNQLASAIDYAHQHGVVHRDIKPSNVLIDEQGKVYLVDFGIVHLFDSGPYAVDEAPTRLTTTGKIYGTPAYMAPERFKGEQAEPATDVYSLGVMLYLLVTGQLPFKADSPLVVGMKHVNEMPLSPRSLRPDLPEAAEATILKALAKRPADRFASAEALAAAFYAGIKGQWVKGLWPLPLTVPPKQEETQVEQPIVVPVPENPAQPNPLVLRPALASSFADNPVADQPTWANPAPVVPPRSHARNWPLVLLWGAVLIAAVVFFVLLLQGLPNVPPLFLPPSSSTPTATPANNNAGGVGVPTATPAVGSTPPAVATPTPTPVPTPTPPPPRPTPTSGATPPATPAPSPTPAPPPPLTPPPIPTLTPTLPPIPTLTP